MASPDIQRLRALQTSINDSLDGYIKALESNENSQPGQKEQMQASVNGAAEQLVRLTAIPIVEVLRLGFKPVFNVALRVASDLDLYNIVQESETLSSIAQKTGADETLLLRIMRALVSIDVFGEPQAYTYTSTPLSKALGTPGFRDWIKVCFETLQPVWSEMPSFFASNGYKDMTDLNNNATIKVYGGNLWEFFAKNPKREAEFASAMTLSEALTASIHTSFSYDAAIAEFKTVPDYENVPFIIDVGGGRGQYLNGLIETSPNIPGRKIVQDLPGVIESIPQGRPYEGMAHDFFTPQPIQGAKFYHIRNVLHDWPDESCKQIIRQIRPAMKPGFSRLLLQNFTLPESGVSFDDAMCDLGMWSVCGIERNEKQFRDMLRETGFKVVSITRANVGTTAMIEAALDDE